MSDLDLEPIESWAREELDRKNAAREQVLRWSRELVRACANSIRAVHRRDFPQADELLHQASELNARICSTLEDMADIYWTGYVQDAQKEYSEASIVFAVIFGQPIPGATVLGVEPAAYLNGLGEAAGEMRRYVLDIIRHGNAERSEYILGVMEDIYSLLVTVDFPDAITDGLRRTTDMVRGVLERTRGDITFAIQQRQLTEALARATNEGSAG